MLITTKKRKKWKIVRVRDVGKSDQIENWYLDKVSSDSISLIFLGCVPSSGVSIDTFYLGHLTSPAISYSLLAGLNLASRKTSGKCIPDE